MAGNMGMNFEVMREQITVCNTQRENVNNVVSGMDGVLSALESAWQGAAYESYAQRYQELRQHIVNAGTLIEEISGALTQTVATFEDTDNSIANSWRG